MSRGRGHHTGGSSDSGSAYRLGGSPASQTFTHDESVRGVYDGSPESWCNRLEGESYLSRQRTIVSLRSRATERLVAIAGTNSLPRLCSGQSGAPQSRACEDGGNLFPALGATTLLSESEPPPPHWHGKADGKTRRRRRGAWAWGLLRGSRVGPRGSRTAGTDAVASRAYRRR